MTTTNLAKCLSIPALFVMVGAIIVVVTGCTGFQQAQSPTGDTFVELDVEPSDAALFVDDDYMGTADGWQHGMVPVEPGLRRLKIDAEGYIPQRLDIDVDQGRTITVTARLEPEITTPDGEQLDEAPQRDDGPQQSDDDDDTIAPPDHPTAPE